MTPSVFRPVRAAVAVVALYALLVGLYLPGFARAGALAGFQVLCAPGHETGGRPDDPVPPAGQCCLATCAGTRLLPGPAAASALAEPLRQARHLTWSFGADPIEAGRHPPTAQARGPPLV